MKTTTYEIIGASSGILSTIVIEWSHIAEKAIETGIIALIGGICGAIGGFIVAWFFKKYLKVEKR